jgi:hypothetical protein
MRAVHRGGAATVVAVCFLVITLVIALSCEAQAREPRARRYVPMRDAPEGLAAEAPDEYGGLRAAAAAVDTYCIVWYDFDPSDWQGWTRRDYTAQWDTFFHMDDFAGLGGGTYGHLVPIEGSRSAWCGARPGSDEYLCGWRTPPGYGNGWDQALVTDALYFIGPLNISYHGVFDSEPQYDKTTVEYQWGDEWVVIASYEGFVDTIATHTLYLPSYKTKLRFHFKSDGAWSDQDGLWDTDGACIIDSITVADDGGIGWNFEDFEEDDPQYYTRIWNFEPGYPGFGMYSALETNLIDKDPCGENTTAQIVFFEGSTVMSDDYPGLPVTPFCQGGGGLEEPCQNEVAQSPVIDMTRYSTACDETQDADIPPGVLPELGGAVLRFTVYRDNPLANLASYTWEVRPYFDGCPGQWLDREFAYYGSEREYLQLSYDISDMVAGDNPLQIKLKMFDMCSVWYLTFGDCAEHTPAPYFDNVRLYRYSTAGPQWNARGHDLFQDTFPEDAGDIESWCRADMARDINFDHEGSIVPGDSAIVFCSAPLNGLDTLPTGEPRIYCHVNVEYIGIGSKPDLFGSQLEGDCGRYISDDGDWTVLLCDSALVGGGPSWLWNGYEIDLNDSLFTRGYMIEYYFKAYDLDGISTTCPETAEQPNGDRFEFTCLPTLVTDALYVDDFDGRGTFEGLAQLYIEQAWEDVMSYPLDRYDVNAPTSCISNGPGSRATWEQLAGYNSIIWDSGDLSACTISDGTEYSDKSDDAALLRDWMRNQGSHDHGLAILGDGVALDLAGSTAPAAVELMQGICGVSLEHDSYFDLTGGVQGGGVANPLVTGVAGTQFDGLEYYAFGGCPTIDDFDVIDTIGAGTFCLQYPDYGGDQYFAGVRTQQADDFGQDMWSLWIGHSFMHVRDAHLGVLARNQLMLGIKYCIWAGPPNTDITGDETPAATTLARCWPNPFNPATTIAFTLREKGPVTLKIYDVSGRLVRTLVDETRDAGRYDVVWDGRNDGGRGVASGIYFCRMQTADFERSEKMVMLR